MKKTIGMILPAIGAVCLLGCMLLTVGCSNKDYADDAYHADDTHYAGVTLYADDAYLDAAPYQDGFLAVGTEGHFDRIGADGTIATTGETITDKTLLAVAADRADAVAVGADGTAVHLSAEGSVRLLNVGVNTSLQSVCCFKGQWLVGTDDGIVLCSDDLSTWSEQKLELEGGITGLAADDERCVAVTERGETATTTDGNVWTVLDYNEYYAKNVAFQDIIPADGAFWAYGIGMDGTSEIVGTAMGGVWSSRTMEVYQQDDTLDISQERITALAYDGTQLLGAYGTGNLLVMPECAECNEIKTVADMPVYAMACNGETVLIAGQDYSIQVTDNGTVRQYAIKAAAARELQDNGALIIDVRSEEDYTQEHIPNSIHIDVSEVEEKLPEFCPRQDQELIFYCSMGKRSAEALEKALEMGYPNVYNLGSIDNWPYGLTTDGE